MALELLHESVSSEHGKDGDVALRRTIEQIVAAVETCTNNTNCNRLSSIECQSRTDVAKLTNLVIRTDDAGYMPIHGKSG